LLVVVTIIVMLVAILLPSMNNARETARAVVCLSNDRQITIAWTGYSTDNDGRLVCLTTSSPPPANAIVNFYGNLTCWVDVLAPYVGNSHDIFNCPSAAARSPGNPVRLGIGLNHIDLSYLDTYYWGLPQRAELFFRSIRYPNSTVLVADAGLIVNYNEPDPDKWYEDPGSQLFYFLTPDHPDYASSPQGPGLQRRMFNRHRNVAATAMPDGHGELMRTSTVGFQYYAGIASDGSIAKGDAIIGGGNDKYDPRWLWDRN
jgi:hypothetical protein